MTQNEKLLARLRRGPITQLEALTELGIMRLGARIHDLKAEGAEITSEMVEVATLTPGESARVARYRIAPCVAHKWVALTNDAWETRECSVCGELRLPEAGTAGALFPTQQVQP